jgi:hypothetical protein
LRWTFLIWLTILLGHLQKHFECVSCNVIKPFLLMLVVVLMMLDLNVFLHCQRWFLHYWIMQKSRNLIPQ